MIDHSMLDALHGAASRLVSCNFVIDDILTHHTPADAPKVAGWLVTFHTEHGMPYAAYFTAAHLRDGKPPSWCKPLT